MKLLIALFVFWVALQLWGAGRCAEAGGKWVQMGYGVHCVDSDLNDIKYLN